MPEYDLPQVEGLRISEKLDVKKHGTETMWTIYYDLVHSFSTNQIELKALTKDGDLDNAIDLTKPNGIVLLNDPNHSPFNLIVFFANDRIHPSIQSTLAFNLYTLLSKAERKLSSVVKLTLAIYKEL